MVKRFVVWMFVMFTVTACLPQTLPHPWQKKNVTTVVQVKRAGADAARYLVQKHGGRLNDETIQNYLDSLVRRLATYEGYRNQDWQVLVVNDPACDLLAVPGQTVLVYRGFLAAVDSEQELAAALGHAMAHLALDHLARSATEEAFEQPITTTAGNDSTVIRGQQLADYMLQHHYSFEEETQAQALWQQQVGPMGQAAVLSAALCRDGWIERHPNGSATVLPVLPPPPEPLSAVSFDDMHNVLMALVPGYVVFEQGVEQERLDHFPQAIGLYLQAATQSPDQSQILTGLGLAYLKVGELNSAKHHLQRAVRLDGGYYRSRLGLGYVALQLEQFGLAEKELRASQALLPTVQGSYLLAELYQRQGDWQQAEPLFQQVVDGDPHGRLGKAARRALQQRQ
ncbi:Tetratricopeptide TPR_2 [Desulfuromonas acetoxidans DSM 684]|uniref:Tetratricopeptide TPR_2 n=2 Tax=Desulfuromonas acetoxidans TaxID=891 RepID=Q1JY63_DESA6|nr:M48 family metalloprotease [Desulfuromonas acetoxidans]EAT15133.1 Tetratricopeptide TPR_2 [Desulfuromonas acetoxidans DSM 684]MBF0643960.1 tetratricopeptide repeat protein [Desulfuromonas acetoxidans]NVD23198.1 tetratricopeptide repeat protein [Desulfuromonas acetoxidans]